MNPRFKILLIGSITFAVIIGQSKLNTSFVASNEVGAQLSIAVALSQLTLLIRWSVLWMIFLTVFFGHSYLKHLDEKKRDQAADSS